MRRGAGLRSAWPISGNKAEALALLSPLDGAAATPPVHEPAPSCLR